MTRTDYCERCDLPLAMCEHGRWRVIPGPDDRGQAAFVQSLLDDGWLASRARWWQSLWDMAMEDQERSSGLGPWIEARYHGTCAGCGFRWEPGDLIRASDDDGGWLCAVCGSG